MKCHIAACCSVLASTKRRGGVFVHGLWLLPSSWDRWVTLFEEAGYVALTPGWPDDPDFHRVPTRNAGFESRFGAYRE